MPSKDINDAVKLLRDNWDRIRQDYATQNSGKYLVLTATYRSPDEQFDLFKKGRKLDSTGNWVIINKGEVVTNVDGRKILGAHNYKPSRAIDVAVVDNQTGSITWKESDYSSLVEIAKGVGLVSGGSWTSFKDWPHIEVPDYKNYKGA